MDYIRICGWETFQHYKKRNPPWIKLHTSLLDNENFECLHNDSKVLLICLWLLVARKGNGEIPANIDYLKRKLPVGRKVDLQPLIKAGFIEVYQNASNLQAYDASKVLVSDRDRGETKPEAEKSRAFILPTLKEIETYIKEKNYNVDAKKFFDYFTESKWVDSKGNKVRNWKQKIITWSGPNNDRTQNSQTHSNQVRRDDFANQESAFGTTIE